MKDLNEIQCFVKAVELRSLTAASEKLGLPKSSVSRKIKNLENRLGITLLVRTTRNLNLTDAGRSFFERSSSALKELDNAEDTLDTSRQTIEGTLYLTAPMVFATGHFNDLISSFLHENPKVKIDLKLTDRVVDLVAEGFDLAFRLGELKDSTHISKKLKPIRSCIVASPKYLKSRGTPKTINDLEKHELVVFIPDKAPLKWSLKGPSGKKEFMPHGRLNVNEISSVKEAVIRGFGLGLLPNYLIAEQVEAGKLKIVCPEWSSEGNAITMVYPGQKFISPKLRAFIDYTTKHFHL